MMLDTLEADIDVCSRLAADYPKKFKMLFCWNLVYPCVTRSTLQT